MHSLFIETNGIRMHCVEAGTGPLVVLLHGFPESWRSWRHQLPALAEAGFHAIAPDMRGYGQSDRPERVEAYDIFQLTGDIVGLVNALRETRAAIVGHDWGAWIAAHAALLRPDLFHALALLSVPYAPRGPLNQSQWEQRKYPGKVFYQAFLRSPAADQILQADVRSTLLRGFYTLSGDVSPQERWSPVSNPARSFAPHAPLKQPPRITSQELDFLEAEYQHTGFTGGLNYYRNMDRNWAMTPFLDGARILQPALFIAGQRDPVIEFLDEEFESLEGNVPNLKGESVAAGSGPLD